MAQEIKFRLGRWKLFLAVAKVLIALCVLTITIVDSTDLKSNTVVAVTEMSDGHGKLEETQKNQICYT